MNLLEFTYKKADGTTTSRAIIELVKPTTFVEGIDVSQMPQDEFADFCREFSALKAVQHEETMAMLSQFDLKHNYRRFIPEQMSDVVVDYV
jgi:hypothetical protein